ncbi:hypothetical protein [Pseudonocardia sp. GCM10023141]|uniref:hypothetical protein n=1 Tax=Pseudonocardia sp. GCM10023141 TaxID=3252653 RepID=UPI0036078E9E
MARYGAQFGPDITFLGVERCDLGGAGDLCRRRRRHPRGPFDGGTSHRAGTRFGPQGRIIAYELPVVGVEVSPPYDHADITSFLANRVVLEALSRIARRRRDHADGTTWDPTLPLLADRPDRRPGTQST